MYKSMVSSAQSESNSSLDAKYTVAEILSSMTGGANQTPLTPVSFSSGAGAPVYPPSSASLLTPTTLANLERTFDLANEGQAAATSESGFVPPVVNPIVIDPSVGAPAAMGVKREYDQGWDDEMSSCSSNDPEWGGSPSKRAKNSLVPPIDPNTFLVANSRRPTGPRKEKRLESLSQEEAGRRLQRRERNKQAAAKCRQRRVDQTNVLINETENLEDEKSKLETEIHHLQQQKEQLEFLLDAHRPLCKHNGHHPASAAVKLEQQAPPPMAYSSAIAGTSMSRPTSLPLRTTQAQVTSATGVPISTPSSGVFSSIGLDTLMDGHTGLTPLTGAPSCGSQVQLQRNSSDSGGSPSDISASNTNLISL